MWKSFNESLKNIWKLEGRASRSEFWTFSCIVWVAALVINIPFGYRVNISFTDLIVSQVISILCLILTFSILVRRLNDRDINGKIHALVFYLWYFLSSFSILLMEIDLINLYLYMIFSFLSLPIMIYYLYQTCRRGSQGSNKHGVDPLAQP